METSTTTATVNTDLSPEVQEEIKSHAIEYFDRATRLNHKPSAVINYLSSVEFLVGSDRSRLDLYLKTFMDAAAQKVLDGNYGSLTELLRLIELATLTSKEPITAFIEKYQIRDVPFMTFLQDFESAYNGGKGTISDLLAVIDRYKIVSF